MAIMQVSRKIDYALRAVIHLANEEDGERACTVSEIAAREHAVAELERRLAKDWADADTLAAHRAARDELQTLLVRWEQLFDQAQA